MEELKNAIAQLLAQVDDNTGFQTLMERFVQELESHPEALGDLAGSYRLKTDDTGLEIAFELKEGSLRTLEASEKAEATISGKEGDLLKLIRKELNPMYAMFTGKVKVQGSMQALGKFSQLVM